MMDCQTAIEYVNAYADNMLNKEEAEQLFSHINSCSKCKKYFNDIIAVKKAVSGLGEVQPPAGLALSAIKKARKHKIPVFAYASAGIAAAIALVAVFSSNIFNNSNGMGREKFMAPAAYSQAAGADNGPQAECAPEEEFVYDLASAPTPLPAATMAPSFGGDSLDSMESPRKASVQFINVPAVVSEDFRRLLVDFLAENNIDYESYTAGLEKISFTITEDKLDDLNSLIEQYLQHEEKLNTGTIQFIFNK